MYFHILEMKELEKQTNAMLVSDGKELRSLDLHLKCDGDLLPTFRSDVGIDMVIYTNETVGKSFLALSLGKNFVF
jgi:hypothetical protein